MPDSSVGEHGTIFRHAGPKTSDRQILKDDFEGGASLSGLLDAVNALAEDLSLDAVLDRLIHSACELVGAKYGALGVIGDDRTLSHFITAGISEEDARRIPHAPLGRGILGLLVNDPHPLRLQDLKQHPASYGFPDNHPPMASFLGVPVRVRNAVFGNLYLTEKEGGGDFTQHDERIAVGLATAAGVAITNARLFEESQDRQRLLEEKDRILQGLLDASQKREQLLKTTLETISVGVHAMDETGQRTLGNRALDEIVRSLQPGSAQSGAAGGPALRGALSDAAMSAAEIAARTVPFFGPDGKTPVPTDQVPLMRAARGEEFTDVVVRVGTEHGRRAYSCTARNMVDHAGHRTGSVAAFTDVTSLIAALEAKDDFLSNVSHELRTPLTSIIGYLDLVLDEPIELPDQVNSALKIAERNALRLYKMVDELLAMAAGRVTVVPTDIDMAAVVREAAEAVAPLAAERGIRMVLDVAETLPALADGDRMGQVMNNLLSNAIKYSFDGGTVTVHASCEGDDLALQVSDEGIGMNGQDLSEVFTKFFRAADVRRRAIPGVGLGLRITKSILEAHSGSISLQSVPDRGTTVTVSIPCRGPARG